MSDERAVKVGQFSQSGRVQQPQAELAGYYEPTQIADLTRSGRLLVVADGVGGAASGEVASRYAVQKILHNFYHSREPNLEKRLLEVIHQTNRAIFEQNRRYPERRAIGTTLLAALIHQNKLVVASVGDGRAYVVWDQDIEHLTGDTSSPQRQAREVKADSADVSKESKPAETPAEQKESGPPESSEGETLVKSSAEEAKSRLLAEKDPSTLSLTPHPHTPAPSLRVPSALGLTEQIEIEVFSRRLFPGDIVVLCSGGLTGYVSEAEIAQTVGQHPPALGSRHLVELASKRGSRDTLSVSMTRVLSKPITQAAPARQPLPLVPDWDTLAKPITRPLSPIPPGLDHRPNETRRRWPIFAATAVTLLLFGLMGFLAGGYLASEGRLSEAEPDKAGGGVLSQSEETTDQDEAAEFSQKDAASGQDGTVTPGATHQDAVGVQAQTNLTPALVAESNSPIPTPTAPTGLRSGDVIMPTVPAPKPTPVPTIALPAGCDNKGRFAGDVTVEDGTEFAPGEAFDKVWSVTNYGTCPWGGGYTVRFMGGDSMGAPESVPLTVVVGPEATSVISIPMVAPMTEGTYRGTWQLHSLTGEPFGPDLYLEIKVVPGILPVNATEATMLYDFVANASQAAWTAGNGTYTVVEVPIDRSLVIPDPQGIVAVGPAELRGDVRSPGNALLTHPHLELGVIEGAYALTTPLQPTDAIIGSLGLPKAAAINDDGVTFELVFKPAAGPDQLLFSKLVKYEDSPVIVRQRLNTIQSGQTGAFILRVKGGDSLSYDWATWIELRLVRP